MDMEDSEYGGLADSGAITARGAAHQPLAALAQQNFIHIAIEDSQVDLTASYAQKINMPDLATDINDIQLSFEDVHPKHGDQFPKDIEEGSRTEACYKNTAAWIEWKTVETVDPKIHPRVKKLAALLSKTTAPSGSAPLPAAATSSTHKKVALVSFSRSQPPCPRSQNRYLCTICSQPASLTCRPSPSASRSCVSLPRPSSAYTR